jgi:hypothetical protein
LETKELTAGYTELEQRMDSNSVMLLREMRDTLDPELKARLFEQAADQEASLMSEVLDGAVITDFKFTTQDGRLYLLQPNGVTNWQLMHEYGVARAKAKAAEDEGFRPYAAIAQAELEEARLQEEMVKAGRPAAMVKLSLCGDDVMTVEQLGEIGRDANAQRAFLRVSVFDGQDLHIHSRSIDGVSLNDGRGIADGWGEFDKPLIDMKPDASSVDILRGHIYFNENQLDVTEMHQLADNLVAAFDERQCQRTGKAYKAGRSPEGVDTYRFVLENQDLLRAHMDSLLALAARAELPVGHVSTLTNDLRYDIMASYKQRLEGNWQDFGSLAESVAAAGESERANGTEFWGCDSVVSANSANTGYVNAEAGHRPSLVERQKIAKNLQEEVKGKGSCAACSAEGNLFGCGLCSRCNKEWCEKYEASGEQTPINKLGRFGRGRAESNSSTESFAEYWSRLGREIELNRLEKEEDLVEYA